MDRWKLPDGLDGDYDHGWEHGYAAAISHVRTRLGLSPDSTHEQVIDAVRGVRQAHPVRDESVPPPGVTLQRCMQHGNPGVQIHYYDAIGLVDGVECSLGDIVDEKEVPEVLRLLWAKYDREHGYAPPTKQDAPPNWPEIEEAVFRVIIQRATAIAIDGDELPPYVDDAIVSLRDVMPRDAFEAAREKADPQSEATKSALGDCKTEEEAIAKAQALIAKLKANRAPTYAEVLEAAAAAKREIDSEWPAWKKGL